MNYAAFDINLGSLAVKRSKAISEPGVITKAITVDWGRKWVSLFFFFFLIVLGLYGTSALSFLGLQWKCNSNGNPSTGVNEHSSGKVSGATPVYSSCFSYFKFYSW